MSLYAESWPGSHVLEKNPGDLITAEWIVFNDGAQAAFAQLIMGPIPDPVTGRMARGNAVPVPAGTPTLPGQATVRVTYPLDMAAPRGGPFAITLTMRQVTATEELIGLVKSHTWSLTVLDEGGGGDMVIVPVGDPVIT